MPAAACSRDATRKPSTLRTRARLRDGRNSTASSTRTLPVATVPAMMRASSPRTGNLYTSCTGSRSACAVSAPALANASICSSSAAPSYQGVRSEPATRLSPWRPLTGMNPRGSTWISPRNASYSSRMALKTVSS